jgi:hypothetical protein
MWFQITKLSKLAKIPFGFIDHLSTIVLFPKQQPVRLDVTFPNACVFARENMRPVLSGERPGLGQKAHHCFEVGDVQSATLAELIRLLEIRRTNL